MDSKKVLTWLGIGIGIAFLIGVVSVFTGTIIWLIWPVAIPAAFPGLVASGTIAAKLSWWASVCLSWIFGLLIKSSQSNSSHS